MAEIYGREKYADLMIFDALICNKDRHLGNFGYLIDNDTDNYLKPAPLFDNGFSVMYSYRLRRATLYAVYTSLT